MSYTKRKPKHYGELIPVATARRMKKAFAEFAQAHLGGIRPEGAPAGDYQPEAYVLSKEFIEEILNQNENCAYLKIYFGMDNKGKIQVMLAPAAANKIRIPLRKSTQKEAMVSMTGPSGNNGDGDYLADKAGAVPPPWADV